MVCSDLHMLLIVPVVRAVRWFLNARGPESSELHAFPLGTACGEDVHHPCVFFLERKNVGQVAGVRSFAGGTDAWTGNVNSELDLDQVSNGW